MKSFKCNCDEAHVRLVLGLILRDGHWSEGPHGKLVYRAPCGIVINYWPRTKSIHCQGPEEIASEFDWRLRRDLEVDR